jgi:hypothetical protein
MRCARGCVGSGRGDTRVQQRSANTAGPRSKDAGNAIAFHLLWVEISDPIERSRGRLPIVSKKMAAGPRDSLHRRACAGVRETPTGRFRRQHFPRFADRTRFFERSGSNLSGSSSCPKPLGSTRTRVAWRSRQGCRSCVHPWWPGVGTLRPAGQPCNGRILRLPMASNEWRIGGDL